MKYTEKATAELYKAFDLLNREYYKGSLQEPVISITSTARKNAYGWFTFDKIWQDSTGEIQKHEIAIGAEFLNRPYIEVIQTLHHEMIHLYCKSNEIKDTAKKGKMHNDNFKEQCESRGFTFEGQEKHPKLGWYAPQLTEEAIEIIEGWELDEEAFKLARTIPAKKKRKPTYRYFCPGCETKFTLKKDVNLTCTDCDMPFIDPDAPPEDEEENDEESSD